MNAIQITDEHLENVRREMMKAAAESLEIAADKLRELGDSAAWGEATSVLTTDAMSSVNIARIDLESVWALGWPANSWGD